MPSSYSGVAAGVVEEAAAAVAGDADAKFAMASRNAVVSASVPAVTRRQPGRPISRIRMPRSRSA
jgi:hypothetical protein